MRVRNATVSIGLMKVCPDFWRTLTLSVYESFLLLLGRASFFGSTAAPIGPGALGSSIFFGSGSGVAGFAARGTGVSSLSVGAGALQLHSSSDAIRIVKARIAAPGAAERPDERSIRVG